MRIGIGYDIHPFIEDKPFVLAGVEIPYIRGLAGHSDGDVLLHAIIDALLGAMGEGDIGKFFPDTDPAFKGISSVILLEKINSIVKEKHFKIVNIDTVVIAEVPRFEPFKEAMANKVSQTLGIDRECINIKAKTNEKLDSIGKEEAVASFSVVLLEKTKRR